MKTKIVNINIEGRIHSFAGHEFESVEEATKQLGKDSVLTCINYAYGIMERASEYKKILENKTIQRSIK